MEHKKIAFIGCGNMARSLIGGLIADKVDPERLAAADPDDMQRRVVSDRFGVNTSADNNAVIQEADIVVFAVKPQLMRDVIGHSADALGRSSKLIISIAAGVRLASIMRWLNRATAVIRVMPNTPALIRAGAAALIANEQATASDRNTAEAMMRSVGTVIWLDNEAQMDGVTALSGSGPAYFFYIMEVLEKTALNLGLDKQQARLLTIETALGAAKMALLSSSAPATLRQQVTSPGGTTERALKVLMNGTLDNVFDEALAAARQRSVELSEEFGK